VCNATQVLVYALHILVGMLLTFEQRYFKEFFCKNVVQNNRIY